MAVLGHKFNARHYLRAGAYANWLSTRYRDAEWVEEYNNIITRIDHRGNAPSLNAFAQWQYRPTNQITFNMGLHSMAFFWNDKVSVEPRAALQYKLDDNQSISLGYGLHSQLQPLNNYFVENENGQLINPELDFSKAHHLVLGYDRKLSDVVRIKSELYYQSLFNMPVAADERNAFYLLNENFGLSYEPLANTGKGRNYGVEFTVEHFLHRGFYMLLSSAWYKAQYQGSDEVWHSSRYDNRMVNTLTAGKQWDWTRKDKDRTIGLNIKIIQAGGQRATPLDLEASQASGKVVLDESRSFEDQLPGYFRLDWGVQLQRNYRKMTTTVSLDVQNTTNRENIFGVYYDEETFERKLYTQTPLSPILAYKIQF